jgi:serine/threonine protein kinase
VTTDPHSGQRPLPDLIAGRYRIVSRLGVGGMGIVYKATDIQLNRAVAVKALEDRRLLFPGSAGKLKAEALAAASLDHPYICKVYELVETPHDTFIVMEFVEGETLASVLKRGPLPLARTLQIGREIAEGLANAHAGGLVHRDVKPANVMVTPSGHIKLLDFGVAGADVESLSADQTRTVSPQVTLHAGTPQYMAPEQAAGQPVTARADLFSLGVLLYECLTTSLPFSGTTTFDYVRHVMQSPPRRLDRIAPDTPADLVDLIEQCLEKTPASRPVSADVVVAQLRRLSEALASAGGSLRTAGQARSGRRWQIVAAVAIAAAALALGWRFVWPRGDTGETTRQLRPFVTSAALESESQVSPDGQWVSFISTSAGTTQIMVQRVDGGEARPLTLGSGRPVSQIWSPNGEQLACILRVQSEWLLQIYPAFFGGTPVQTVSLSATQPKEVLGLQVVSLRRWIGRSIFLAASQEGESLRRLDLDAPTTLVDLTAGWTLPGTLRDIDLRPDGKAVAMTRWSGTQSDLWIANIDGSSASQVTNDAFFDREPRWNGPGDRIIFGSNRGGQIDLWDVDPRSKALTQLTSGEAEKTVTNTSSDGALISFEWTSRQAKLWSWRPSDPGGTQLTQDALSDYSPVLAGNHRTVAFQRSQPTPERGSVIIDAKLFVSPFDGRAIAGPARAIGDGYAPAVSGDGTWMSYLQRASGSQRSTLQVRNLTSGAVITVSGTAVVPMSISTPVDWASPIMAWAPSAADLYFVDQQDVLAIRPYHAGDAAAGPPLAKASGPAEFLRDLFVSPDDKRLSYVVASRKDLVVHVVDLKTGEDRVRATLPGPSVTSGFSRGWIDNGAGLVIVRRLSLNEDLTGDVEVRILDAASPATGTKVGIITKAFVATTRLHPERRVLYVTRLENGVHNLYEFSLATGQLKALTKNTLSGVTFSGFAPAGDAVIGVRDERRQDIWLIQQSSTTRPGNPAGR